MILELRLFTKLRHHLYLQSFCDCLSIPRLTGFYTFGRAMRNLPQYMKSNYFVPKPLHAYSALVGYRARMEARRTIYHSSY
jgi:hypothetical protein